MSAVLDPGALLAANAMSTDKAFSAMPRAPMVPDKVPGTVPVLSLRRGMARVLAGLAEWSRPCEPPEASRRLAPGQ